MIRLIEPNKYGVYINTAIVAQKKWRNNEVLVPFFDFCGYERIKERLCEVGIPFELVSIHELESKTSEEIIDANTIRIQDVSLTSGEWERLYSLFEHSGSNYLMYTGDKDIPDTMWMFAILTGRRIYDDNKSGGISSILVFVDSDVKRDRFMEILELTDEIGGVDVRKGFFYSPYEEKRYELLLKIYLSCVIDHNAGSFVIYDAINNQMITPNIDRRLEVDDILKEKELLLVMGHGNGADMSCGNAVLCGRKENKAIYEKRKNLLPCVCSEKCSRKGIKVNPNDVKSNIVILYTCWGVVFEESIIDKSMALSTDFIYSFNNAVYVSTIDKSNFDQSVCSIITRGVERKEQIGHIIAKFNQYHYKQYKDDRNVLVIFGDPSYMVHKKFDNEQTYGIDEDVEEEYIDSESKEYITDEKEDAGHLILMRMLSNACRRTINDRRCKERLAIVLDSIDLLLEFDQMINILSTNPKIRNAFIRNNRSRIDAIVRRYQNAWMLSYFSIVEFVGGAIQLNYLKLLKRFDEECITEKCPCCESKMIVRQEVIELFKTKHTLHECGNCGFFFEGIGDVIDGEIHVENCLIKTGNNITAEVKYKKISRKRVPYIMAICLEPFIKNNLSKCCYDIKQGKLDLDCGRIVFNSTGLKINDDFGSGMHYLNCIAIVNKNIAFMRRTVNICIQ